MTEIILDFICAIISGGEKGNAEFGVSVQVCSIGNNRCRVIVRHNIGDHDFNGALRMAYIYKNQASMYYNKIVEQYNLSRIERDVYVGSSPNEFLQMLRGEDTGGTYYNPQYSDVSFLALEEEVYMAAGDCVTALMQGCCAKFPRKSICRDSYGFNIS